MSFRMKGLIPFLLALGTTQLFADGPPRGSFKASEFEQARAESIQTGKPIAVVLTTFDGSCPHTDAGNEEIAKEMKRDYVLIYDDYSPRPLTSAHGPLAPAMRLSMGAKGNVTPCVAVVDGKTLSYLGGVSYKRIRADNRKWEKTMRSEIDTTRSGLDTTTSNSSEKSTSADDSEDAAEMQEWKNVKGKTIRAVVMSKDELNVTFKMEDGKIVKYPLNLLSEESRAAIAENN